MVGVVIFAFSLVTAFTGFISQQNFDGEWIAVNAKDATNSAGIGTLFNVLNYGQMYGLHIILLPMLVATLVGVHVLFVRMKGVVKPIGKVQGGQPSNEESAS